MDGSFDELVAEAEAAPIDGLGLQLARRSGHRGAPELALLRAGRASGPRRRATHARPRVGRRRDAGRACRVFPPLHGRGRGLRAERGRWPRAGSGRAARFVVATRSAIGPRCRSRATPSISSRAGIRWSRGGTRSPACCDRAARTSRSRSVPTASASSSEFMMGPLPPGSQRDPELRARPRRGGRARRSTDLRTERLRTVFDDIGAVVYFLRLVIWIVPGFTVERLPRPAPRAARADPARRPVRRAREPLPDRGAEAAADGPVSAGGSRCRVTSAAASVHSHAITSATSAGSAMCTWSSLDATKRRTSSVIQPVSVTGGCTTLAVMPGFGQLDGSRSSV